MTQYVHKARTYLHFDPAPSARVAERIATDPAKVATHSFYPFLGYTITTPRVKRKPDGGWEKKDKARPIRLAAHLDAAIYSYYAKILGGLYEREVTACQLGDCITAFRKLPGPGRNNIYFAKEVFDFIQSNRPCVAVGLDIEQFFDNLDHKALKDSWMKTLALDRLPDDHFNVFKSLTEFRWVDRQEAFLQLGISRHNPKPKNLKRTRMCSPADFRSKIRGNGLVWANPKIHERRGIPQGSPISALLSNIYMLEFDTAMQAAATSCGGLYRRYCDDIMFVVPPQDASAIITLAKTEIAKLRLTINDAKTVRATFPKDPVAPAEDNQKIQYLGFDFDGQRKQIRLSSLTRYFSKMRRGVRMAKLTKRKHNRKEQRRGQPISPLRTRKLYIHYSFLIRRRFSRKRGNGERQSENFITYAHRCADKMDAPEIKRQVRNHLKILKAEIQKPFG